MARAARTSEAQSGEERPPHDALQDAPLPRATSGLVGHQDAERTLLSAYRSGRLHHGWLLVGERGIGRATLALRFARFLFAHPDASSPAVLEARDLAVAPDHPAARMLSAGSHPNLLHIQREWDDRNRRYRSDLSVQAVRRIMPFLGTTAGEGGWRVVIVDPADDMNRSAANAILKTLEEPPRMTVFLLLARSRGALLPTILSRCRGLDLAPLSPGDVRRVVGTIAGGPGSSAEDELAARLSGGSPRRLLELVRGDGVRLYRLLVQAIETGSAEAQQKVASLAGEAAGFEQLMELFNDYLGRRVRGEAEPEASSRPPAVPLVTWADLWEKAVVSRRDVDIYNLDRRQFVLDLLESCTAALDQSAVPNRH